MARRLLLSLLSSVAMLALVAVPASSADAQSQGFKVLSPAPEAFLQKARVRIEIGAPRSAKAFNARLNGRAITSSFERTKSGSWKAEVGSARLRRGADHLVVSATIGGRRDYDGARFYVGRRRPALLTVVGPKRKGGAIRTTVRSSVEPEILRATLNGKRIAWPPRRWALRKLPLQIGADDGLRFGANHLRVFAARRDGNYDVEDRTIHVPRDWPLAGAGPDRRVAAGATVRLDGRGSLPVHGHGDDLGYHWKLVRKPAGSNAKLLRAHSMRPLLKTDGPGKYQVRLAVTEGGGTDAMGGHGGDAPLIGPGSDDVAEVTATEDAPPIGMPLETIDANGAGTETGIRFGSHDYWTGQGNRVQALIVERDTLKVLASPTYPGTQKNAEELEAEIKKWGGSKTIVALADPAQAVVEKISPGFLKVAQSLGLTPQQSEKIGQLRPGWSVVGIPGSGDGAYLGAGENSDARDAGQVRGNLDGYLEESDAGSGGFSFVPAERFLYETDVAGAPAGHNTIRIGGATYTSTALPSCATGGFQVVVVLAETLKPFSNETFATNGCNPAVDDEGVKNVAAAVAAVYLGGAEAEEGPKLVFVQTIGSPRDLTSGSWRELALALEKVGATGSVIGEARGGYALVGGVGVEALPLTESSQTLTGKEALLSGILEPGRSNSFMPMLSSVGNAQPYELSAIAYQPATAWPVFGTAAENEAALEYTAKLLNLGSKAPCTEPARPDVRSQYCNLEHRNEWRAIAGELKAAPYQPGHGFSESTWKSLKAELPGEFEDVQGTWNLIETLQSAFNGSSNSALVNLKKIALEIEESTKPPATSEVAGWWLELIANILSTVSYYNFGVDGEVVEKVTGTLSGAVFIAAQASNDPQGAPETETFQIEADDFATDLAEKYLAASNGLGLVGELIVSDYGKLTAVQKAGLLGIDEKTLSQLKNVLGPGSRSWSWQKLLPTSYEPFSLASSKEYDNPLPTNAAEYVCTEPLEIEGSEPYAAFPHAPKNAQLRTRSPNEELGVLVLHGSPLPNGTTQTEPQTPPKALLEPLFKSESEGGLGLYAPWFWRSAFDYPSKTTRTVHCGSPFEP